MQQTKQISLLALCVLILGILAACQTPPAAPTDQPPTAGLPEEAPTGELVTSEAPTTAATTAETPAAEIAATATPLPITEGGEVEETANQSWARIQSLGRIGAGTAADYPPFEYYDPNSGLTGFDVALMQAIGERLGLVVDFTDIAFEGLGDSLLSGQVDLAIAALSVTPERETTVDFSNVYYIGEDAVLAADGTETGEIQAAADMAPFTLGVQSASVYETWARDNLIETGLMPEENLYVYARADQAITDLAGGRVQLVMMDRLPAEVAEQNFDVRIVASGLNRQRFAIAVPKGEDTLRREINRVLTDLQNEGLLADLAEEYLELEEVPPIEEVTPVAPGDGGGVQACSDAMAFIGDLNLDDNNMASPPIMSPGQAFRKGWRVQNIGTCTWNNQYSLNYVSGNVSAAQMGGSTVPVFGTVLPGQTYDFWVDLVAPSFPGTYQGFWEMRNSESEPFGQRLWVGIRVPAPPTPVPQPTQTPSPSISFTVNRTQIREGECVTFSWNVQNIQAVWFYPNGADYRSHPTTGQNGSTECPRTTTTYNLRVLNTNGTVETRQITIVVEPSNEAPKITSFTVTPPSITQGQCVQVSWRVEGNVDSVVISRDSSVLWSGAPIAGTTNDCPPNTGFAIYVIEARGPGGSARLQQNVGVQ